MTCFFASFASSSCTCSPPALLGAVEIGILSDSICATSSILHIRVHMLFQTLYFLNSFNYAISKKILFCAFIVNDSTYE